jgi:hypothetical protein
MEKKVMISFIVIATLSLLWVFNYMCRTEHQTDFTASNPDLYSAPQTGNGGVESALVETEMRETGRLEIENKNGLNTELRPKKLEKVRVTVKHQNSATHKKSDNATVNGLKPNDAFDFCLESISIQPSAKLANEYEFNYKRIRGNVAIPGEETVHTFILKPRIDHS